MTDDRTLRLVLRLFSKRYRAERGPEIAAVYADATAGAGRFVRLRELYGVAAHGARQRLRLTASQPLGQLLGAAAPLVAGMGAGVALVWGLLFLDLGRVGLSGLLWLAPYGLALPALPAVLLGRATVARLCAVLAGIGTLASIGALVAQGPGVIVVRDAASLLQAVAEYGAPLVWAVLLLAAPRELVRRPERYWPILLAVGAGPLVIAGLVAVLFGHQVPFHLLGLLVVLFANALLVLTVRLGGLSPAALAVGWLPLLLPFTELTLSARAGAARVVGPVLLLALLVGIAGRLFGRSRAVAVGR
ncbi:hypothetical protein [Kitasatospora azatica]|uniref:hypothetical protein n=1 Tax=Kitasatospora azatica TaxID=58347 RepID=UPI00055B9245|nr:hypothetical protein [Kitasatospora azatica]